MRRLKGFVAGVLIAGIGLVQTSCVGPFRLFNNVLDWNQNVGGKFVNAAIFFVFLVIPVYEVILFIDAVILNTIEFWTGSNPISMAPGETESQIVKGEDGKTYKITASQNRFDVVNLSDNSGEGKFALVFDPEETKWVYEDDSKALDLVKFNDDETVTVFLPEGGERTFSQTELAAMDKKSIQNTLMNSYAFKE